jgi:hypothetical protein
MSAAGNPTKHSDAAINTTMQNRQYDITKDYTDRRLAMNKHQNTGPLCGQRGEPD